MRLSFHLAGEKAFFCGNGKARRDLWQADVVGDESIYTYSIQLSKAWKQIEHALKVGTIRLCLCSELNWGRLFFCCFWFGNKINFMSFSVILGTCSFPCWFQFLTDFSWKNTRRYKRFKLYHLYECTQWKYTIVLYILWQLLFAVQYT